MNYLFSAVVDLTIIREDNSVINPEIYSFLKSNEDTLFGFESISPQTYDVELSQLPTVRYKFRTLNTEEDDTTIKMLPNPDIFFDSGEESTMIVTVNEVVTPGDIFPIKGIANYVAGLCFIAIPLAEYGSLIAPFFNFDPSGHILKFVQILRYLSRLRYFKMGYGLILTTFYREFAKTFEKPSSKGLDYIRINSNGTKAKFTSEEVPLTVFDGSFLKTILYSLSFLLKLLLALKLQEFKKEKSITETWCKFINYHQ